jgi:hypothetical protein
MLELLVAPLDGTDFEFDAATLARAAERWPGSRVEVPQGRRASVAQLDIDLPTADGGMVQLVVLAGGAVSLDTTTKPGAAQVLAWLAGNAGLPADGGVVVFHWTDGSYPLRVGATIEELLADAT